VPVRAEPLDAAESQSSDSAQRRAVEIETNIIRITVIQRPFARRALKVEETAPLFAVILRAEGPKDPTRDEWNPSLALLRNRLS
jgi:hypothetical protein